MDIYQTGNQTKGIQQNQHQNPKISKFQFAYCKVKQKKLTAILEKNH